MKKALIICTTLVALCFLAYAGTNVAKDVDKTVLTATAISTNDVVKTDDATIEKIDLNAELQRLQEELKSNPSLKARVDEIARELGLLVETPRNRGNLDVPGDDCTDPLLVTDAFADVGNTNCSRGYTINPTCNGLYGDGEDAVYEWTVTADACFDVTLDPKGTTYSGFFVLDACADGAGCLLEVNSSSGTPKSGTVELAAGTYYIVVDTWAAPDCIPEYDLSAVVVPCPDPCVYVDGPDECTAAVAVPVGTSVDGSTLNATAGVDPGACVTSISSPDVWYSTVGTGNTITVSLCDPCTSPFDTKVQIWLACDDCATLVCVTGNDDGAACSEYQSEVSFCSVVGATYYIRVGGYSGTGDFRMTVTDDGIQCADGVPCIADPCVPDFSATLDCQTEYRLVGNTTGAGDDCDQRAADDHIWEIIITEAGEYNFDMCANAPGGDPCAWDSYIYLMTECCGGTVICSADDGCGCYGMSSIVCCYLDPGTYYLVIEGYSAGNAGAYDVTVTCCDPDPLGQCCYYDLFSNPLCDDITQTECDAVFGEWDPTKTCADVCCLHQGPPPNDVCTDLTNCATNVVTELVPLTLCGNNECVSDVVDCIGIPIVWECFTIEECMNVTIDFCGSDAGGWIYIVVSPDCNCNWIFWDGQAADTWTLCMDAGDPLPNGTMVFSGLPAGTYYIPIHEALTPNYCVQVSVEPCAPPYLCDCCEGPTAHSADPEPDLPVSDTLATTCLTINVPIEYQITDLNVCLDITHTFDGDLDITLQSPAGTVVNLSIGNGGGGDNFAMTVFDDESPNPIATGTAPFAECYSPDGLLSDFDLENALGDWLLCVTDNWAGDHGTLNYACLTFEYDIILAAELAGFDAIAGDREVTLLWETSSETDNDHFTITRDGETVGRVEAEGTASGADYSWTENGLTNGTEYTYTVFAEDVNGVSTEMFTINATPSLSAATVTEYALHQNFPNPFNPGTSIAFDMVDAGFVNLKVYNLLGQEVAVVVNGTMDAGRHIVNFTANNLPSGLYLYRIETNGFSAQKKMVLMK